jgi:hypothetical protein
MRITPTYFGGGIKNMLINETTTFHHKKALKQKESASLLFSQILPITFFYPYVTRKIDV